MTRRVDYSRTGRLVLLIVLVLATGAVGLHQVVLAISREPGIQRGWSAPTRALVVQLQKLAPHVAGADVAYFLSAEHDEEPEMKFWLQYVLAPLVIRPEPFPPSRTVLEGLDAGRPLIMDRSSPRLLAAARRIVKRHAEEMGYAVDFAAVGHYLVARRSKE